jgi:hypothetical protein
MFLYVVQVSTCFVEPYELAFPSRGRFRTGTRSSDKVLYKLKKNTETFKMLKNAYGEQRLSSKSAFEWNKRFKKDESLYKT